jgi:hypothetical protein
MRLGLYTFASLAFIGLVAGFVYTLVPGNFLLDIAGINLTLPIALWVVLPLLFLLLLTILHMLYHGTRSYFARRKWQRDADTMQDALYWSLIAEPKSHNYTIPQMREGAALLSYTSLILHDLPEGVSNKLAKTVEWIKQIHNGEYVDLKEKKVERFMGKNNPILVKNHCNRLAKEPDYADVILRAQGDYAKTCVESAMKLALQNDTFFKLKKYSNQLSFADIEVLLDRADAGEDVGLTLDNMEHFIADLELECPQYMRLVASAIKAFDPDENLSLFKKLASERTRAESAYLFLLFRYEMIEKAKDFLEEYEEDDFIAFRAFNTLKKNKYNYKVRDFITAENACK